MKSLKDQIGEVQRKEEDVKLTIDGLAKEADKCYDHIAGESGNTIRWCKR